MLSLCLLKRMIELTAITISDHANGHPSESVDGYAAFPKTSKPSCITAEKGVVEWAFGNECCSK